MKTFLKSADKIELVIIVLFVLTPLISAALFCLKDGKAINDVYLPLGGWSDEITYYKQIEGILSHGMPRGYFGYNQSRAMYGTLGVWGIIPLIPYVLWGFFFGWNYVSPIYANIFFCTAALAAIVLLLRPKKKAMILFSLFWLCNQFLNRYLLSGVVEASVTAQLLIVSTLGLCLLSDNIRSDRNGKSVLTENAALILCTLFICYLSLGRPYFEVLFLIPFWKACKDRKRTWQIILPALAVLVMIVFFINNHFFCSTYFRNLLSFEGIRNGGIPGLFSKLFRSLPEIARLIWYAIRYKGVGVGWYYLLLFIELAAMVIVCIYRKLRHKPTPPMFFITLIGNSLILLSIIEMYDLGVGARHILALIIANALLLAAETNVPVNGILATVCIFSVIQTGNADAPPYRTEEYAAYMNQLEDAFSEAVHVTDNISYENVVAMPTADISVRDPGQSVSTYYGLLFAMPAGVGISLDFQDFYDSPENIRAKYILVHPDGMIRTKLEEIGMYCVYENEELALYSK